MNITNKPILFIDSDCVMCSGFARFVINHSQDILIAPLEGETAIKYLNPPPQVDSIVYFDGSTTHLRSTAILKAAKKFSFPFNSIILLNIFPRFLRDYVYDFIAKHRKNILKSDSKRVLLSSKTEYCEMLKPEERVRILN